MKKLLSLLAILLGGGVFALHAAPKGIPTAFRGNWIDTTTNLWTLGLWDNFAATDASFWDYEKWSGNSKAARATLRRADGIQRNFRFELQNDSTLVMTDAAGRHILLRESPTTAARPFTAPPDTTSFRFGPWVDDSIRVEGFITGERSRNDNFYYWTPDLLGLGFQKHPIQTDSLGRFSLSIPATHTQLRLIGNYLIAGPGDRLFIAFSEKERNLFMGDNARINQEIDRHNPVQIARQYFPEANLDERISDAMSWRYARISARNMALAGIADYCREHRLSHKTQQLCNALIKRSVILEITAMPVKRKGPMAFPYAYFKSGEGIDLADPEIFLGQENGNLHYLLLWLWRTYESPYIIAKAGLSGRDIETFSMGGRFRETDPDRFNDFLARNQTRIDSIFRTITPETRLQWIAPLIDTLIPERGPNRSIAFAHSWATLWSSLEEPLSAQSLALIDSTLSDSPFLRDTLRGINERYRILAGRNAALEIPMGTIDSSLIQPDSILAAILRPYAGKVIYMVFIEPGEPDLETELGSLPAIREKLAEKEIAFIFVSAALYRQKWRNTIAEYGLATPKDIHFKIMPWQMGALVQKYSGNATPAFFLYDKAGVRVNPAPKPSEGDALVQRIEELLAR